MLVLTRQTGEKIIIGKDIEVNILEEKGNQVRVGNDAPKEVAIVRQELLEADDT